MLKRTYRTPPLALDPEMLGISDWVLDRKNMNPFRSGTEDSARYEEGFRRARRG